MSHCRTCECNEPRNFADQRDFPRYCIVHAPELHDTAAPAHASHGFEPDGTLGEIAPFSWADGDPTYSIISSSADLGPDLTRKIIQDAVDAWRAATDGALDPQFTEVNPTAADIVFRFQSEKHNADFHKKPQIIGYAYFPGVREQEDRTNYITFNDSYFYVDQHDPLAGKVVPREKLHDDEYINAKSIILRNVCMHEFGHAIGLPHAKDCPQCVMAPFYNGALDLDGNDIARARAIYHENPDPYKGRSAQAPHPAIGGES